MEENYDRGLYRIAFRFGAFTHVFNHTCQILAVHCLLATTLQMQDKHIFTITRKISGEPSNSWAQNRTKGEMECMTNSLILISTSYLYHVPKMRQSFFDLSRCSLQAYMGKCQELGICLMIFRLCKCNYVALCYPCCHEEMTVTFRKKD